MSTEHNKALALRFAEEVINQHNLAAVDTLFASTYVNHFSPPGAPQGPDGEKQLNAMFFSAFPNCHLTVEDMIAEGDKVVSRWTYQGTHTGEFMGIAPTGKSFTIQGMSVFCLAENKIVDNWTSLDMLALLQQLGVIPSMG